MWAVLRSDTCSVTLGFPRERLGGVSLSSIPGMNAAGAVQHACFVSQRCLTAGVDLFCFSVPMSNARAW